MAVSRSTDGGTTWARDTLGTSSSYVYSLALSPGAPGTAYVGGYENSQPAIYRTTDSGVTWTKLTAAGLVNWPYSIAVRPDNPAVIFAGTGSGIFRSTDSGASFTKVSSSIGYVKSVLVDPSSPSTVYLGTGSQGVYRSTDGGSGWSAFNTGLPETCVNCLAISNSQFIYAGTNGGATYRWYYGVGVGGSEVEPIATDGISIWPSPAFSGVSIAFETASAGEVSVRVYDIQGRLVATPASGSFSPGGHEVAWDGIFEGAPAPAGVYFVTVSDSDGVRTGRLVLVR